MRKRTTSFTKFLNFIMGALVAAAMSFLIIYVDKLEDDLAHRKQLKSEICADVRSLVADLEKRDSKMDERYDILIRKTCDELKDV